MCASNRAFHDQIAERQARPRPRRSRRVVLPRLERHRLSLAAAARIFTRRPISPNSSTRSRSTHRFTTRFGRNLRRSGSSASPRIRDFSSPRSSGRNSRTKRARPPTTRKPCAPVSTSCIAAGRLGAVLLQFPFSFHNTPENLARLGRILGRFREYPLVVEVRHSSWAQPEFYHFLHERHVGICNIDQPMIGRSIKPGERATSAVGYVRLHGRRYDTWFSDDPEIAPSRALQLPLLRRGTRALGERIRHVAAHAETTFVVTNNHFRGQRCRERATADPSARRRQSESSRDAAASLPAARIDRRRAAARADALPAPPPECMSGACSGAKSTHAHVSAANASRIALAN